MGAGALASFASEEGPRLYRLAWLLTRDPEHAADLTQSVLAKLAARGTEGLENLGAYARRALVNEQRNHARRAAAGARAMARHGRSHDVLMEDHARRAEDRDAIWRALDRLSERQRAAVVLRYYEDLSDGDIAEVLSCRPATVRSLVARAMPVLRHEMVNAHHASTDDEAGGQTRRGDGRSGWRRRGTRDER